MFMLYHCIPYLLLNLSNVQAFSRFTTTRSHSNTILYVVDPIVEAYQKSAPEVKDVNELTSYLDKSVNSAKAAVSQAAAAASELAKPPPAIEEGKVYSLFEYLKTQNAQDQGFSFQFNSERIGTLLGNMLEVKNTVISETDKAVSKMFVVKSTVLSETDKVASTPQAAAVASNVQQYFPWYVAAFAIFYSVNTRNNARAEIRREYKEELDMYKARAEEAASAALQAAEGAKSVKDAVLASGTASIKTVSSTVSKLQELQDEKELTKKDIAKVFDDLKTLQMKFDVLLAEKEALETKLSKEDKTEKLLQHTKKNDDDKILEVMKEIDVAMEADKKKKEETKTTTRKRAKSSKTAKSSRVKKDSSKDKLEEVVVAAAEKEKITPKKAKGRKSKVEKPIIVEDVPIIVEDVPIIVEDEEKPFFAVKSPVETIVHPWSKLSQSTLNRKTVKELSSFLEERGAVYTDDKGKPFMKKVLVSTVQEYL